MLSRDMTGVVMSAQGDPVQKSLCPHSLHTVSQVTQVCLLYSFLQSTFQGAACHGPESGRRVACFNSAICLAYVDRICFSASSRELSGPGDGVPQADTHSAMAL